VDLPGAEFAPLVLRSKEIVEQIRDRQWSQPIGMRRCGRSARVTFSHDNSVTGLFILLPDAE